MLVGSVVSQLAFPAPALAQDDVPVALVPAAAVPVDEINDAVPPVTSRAQFHLGASAGYTAFYLPTEIQPADGDSVSGSGELGATIFLRRLVDDGAPLMLQPFLQRVGGFSLSATGGGFTSQVTRAGGVPFERRAAYGSGGLGLDAYVRRFLAITANFAAQYSAVSDYTAYYPVNPSQTSLALYSALGVGLRFADTRIDLGYGVNLNSDDNGSLQVPFWGGAMATLRTVIRQYVDLSLRLAVLDQGAAGGVSIALYPDNNLSLFVSLAYAHGILYANETTTRDRVLGSIGGTMWLSRRLAATLSYAPGWTNGITTSVDHIFRFEMLLRT